MMVTNPPMGLDPEPHPGFHSAVTSARHIVWRQYGFRGNAVTKSDQSNTDRCQDNVI
ncbi:hypothetical protein Hanom_Chr13g01208471 [Helianthus anomalus]